jgi:hypothetical protein
MPVHDWLHDGFGGEGAYRATGTTRLLPAEASVLSRCEWHDAAAEGGGAPSSYIESGGSPLRAACY